MSFLFLLFELQIALSIIYTVRANIVIDSGKKLLVIQSSGRHDGSVSRELINNLVAKLQPVSSVIRETADIPFVDQHWISNSFNPSKSEKDRQALSTTTSLALVDELINAEVVVIGAPIYNFGPPASLKAWVDMICVVGKTFKYGPNGAIPLLAPMKKKAFIVAVSGGVPIGSSVDYCTPYLKFVLGFVGITDVTIIDAPGGNMEKAIQLIDKISVNGRSESEL